MKEPSTRIAFLLPTDEARGPLNQIEILSEGLRQKGVPSIIVVMRGSAGEPRHEAYISLGMKHVWDPRCLFRLNRLVKDQRITILHSRLNAANFWAAVFCLLFRSTRHVMNITNSIETSFRYNHGEILGRLHLLAFRRILVGSHAIVTNSRFLKEELQSTCSTRVPVSVVENAILAPPINHRAETGSFVIGIVSRVESYKRIDDAIRAFPIIFSSLPNAELHIVGTGDHLSTCKRLASRLDTQTAAAVKFLGHRDNIRSTLLSFSVFLHTSESEGQPNAVLEAMSVGIPVVCSRYPGANDLIKDNETGMLYETYNAEDIAEKVKRVLNDKQLRDRLALNAWEHVRDHHAPSQVVDLFLRVYSAVCSRQIGAV